ncbi:hypothetical protein HJG60_010870 [Phyllostomus discolor]|uniref:Uncharacterized protein n=1 Tax=Phyllostomus discolor TaxID=89673 RepID=A0A834A6X6_9CHIR|nr:hypothetical protein HJG60_010870 [Phyllostomus discolor]
MNCTTTTDVSYACAHVQLPPGWFLICGMTIYSYVPANSSGGPCSLGRLMVFMPQKPHLTWVQWDLSLTPNFITDLHLLALLYMSLTMLIMSAMVTYLNGDICRLACTVAKALNATSQAISAISQELGQVREAVLKNCAAVDYLLLRHNHGCEELKGLCCFNLTDGSQLIEHKVKQVNDLVSNTKQRGGSFGIDLPKLSWLPSITSLQEAFIVFILVIFFSIIACCCIQCASLCGSAIRCVPKPPTG